MKNKKYILIGVIFLTLIILIGAGCTEKKQGTENKTQTSSSKTSPKKTFSFDDYIQKYKRREYEIINEEDISLKALGSKNLSDYSVAELKNLPLNIRIKYQVIADVNDPEELKSTLAQIIKDKSIENPDIDEISIQLWKDKESFEKKDYATGSAEWCPNGEWADVTPEIAKNNVRDSYKISYKIEISAFEDGSSAANKNTAPQKTTPNQKSSVAFKLASIEIGNTNPPSSLVASFDNMLSRVKTKCPDKSKEQISDYIATAWEAIRKKGINITLLEIGNDIDKSIPKEMAGYVKCEEIVAALIVLTTNK